MFSTATAFKLGRESLSLRIGNTCKLENWEVHATVLHAYMAMAWIKKYVNRKVDKKYPDRTNWIFRTKVG